MDDSCRAGKITRLAEALRFGQSADAGFLKGLDAIVEEEKKYKQKLALLLAC